MAGMTLCTAILATPKIPHLTFCSIHFSNMLFGSSTSQTPHHVKVFVPFDPLDKLVPKTDSLVESPGGGAFHLNQERQPVMSERASAFTSCFDQPATVTIPLMTGSYTKSIQVII